VYGSRSWPLSVAGQLQVALIAMANRLIALAPIENLYLFCIVSALGGAPMSTVLAAQSILIAGSRREPRWRELHLVFSELACRGEHRPSRQAAMIAGALRTLGGPARRRSGTVLGTFGCAFLGAFAAPPSRGRSASLADESPVLLPTLTPGYNRARAPSRPSVLRCPAPSPIALRSLPAR